MKKSRDIEPRPGFFIRSGTFFFRYRDAISPAVFLTLLVATRPRQPFGSESLDIWLDALGLLLSALGQTLRIAVIGLVYIIRGGKGRKVYAEDLVTGGLFAVSRNPLYLANLMIYFGLLVVWNGPAMYWIGVPFYLFLYTSIVATEEAFLRTKFGPSYEAYCHDVPRWIPNLGRLRPALAGLTFEGWRVVFKEYGTVAALLLTASMLLIAETISLSSYAAHTDRIRGLAGFVVLVIAVWGGTRWLKRRGRRRSRT